jgi:RNA polymerase sigma factor (sigma-70 family)
MENLGAAARTLQNAFDTLIDPYRPDLWRFCISLTRSQWDAEDLVQDTLLKAFSMLGYYFQPFNPKSYLFRMASNCWIDKIRRNKVVIDEIHERRILAVGNQADPADVIGSIDHLLTNVTPKQAVIVLLVDVFDFTSTEVAEMLHATEGAVKASLNRARSKLRKESDITEDSERGRSPSIVSVSPRLVDAYVAAFNNRDPDALASLLTDHAEVDIVHVSQELGKTIARKHSIEGTVNIPTPMYAEYRVLWGEPAFLWFEKISEQYELTNVVRIQEEDEEITKMKAYYFCPELLKLTGNELGLSVRTNGYHYIG